MAKMKAAQISKAGGNFEIVERDIPTPERGEVLIKVEACGVCHSDEMVKEGLFPGNSYPRVPGHEVAGSIETFSLDQVNEAYEHMMSGQARFRAVLKMV